MIKVNWPFSMTFLDYPDNHSQAVLVYVMGCDHGCNECHNKDFQNYDYNESIAIKNHKILYKLVKERCDKFMTKKVVLSGGDPLSPSNYYIIQNFMIRSKNSFDITIYTGYDIDYVKKLLLWPYFKFVKCGRFDINKQQKAEKTNDYIRFASTNQQLYDTDYKLVSENGTYYFGLEI